MAYSLENESAVDDSITFLDFSKALLASSFHRSNTISRIKKSIPGKMKCGLVFQHLPESIHMVRHYEVIGEGCKANMIKLINAAKFG